MKKTRNDKVQVAMAAQKSAGMELGSTGNQALTAYAATSPAMAPVAPVERVKPVRSKVSKTESPFIDESDIELNEAIHGGHFAETEQDLANPDAETEELKEEYEDDQVEESEEGAPESREVEEKEQITVSVKEMVHEINRIAFSFVERGKLEIGAYLLAAVFNDDIDHVLSKNPYKAESLRKICEDPDLRVDRRRLGNWVKAAALHKDLTDNGIDCAGLLTSQLSALLRVKNSNKRRELAMEAGSKRLSVRKITEKADELNHSGMLTNVAKLLRKKINDPLSLLSDTEAVALLEDQERLAKEISFKDRVEIISEIDELGDRIEQCKDFLDKIRDNLLLIDMERLRRRQA